MKFCLNTSTIKPQPLLKKIELSGQAGYDGIELWINDVYDFIGRGGEVREVEQALADHSAELGLDKAVDAATRANAGAR